MFIVKCDIKNCDREANAESGFPFSMPEGFRQVQISIGRTNRKLHLCDKCADARGFTDETKATDDVVEDFVEHIVQEVQDRIEDNN